MQWRTSCPGAPGAAFMARLSGGGGGGAVTSGSGDLGSDLVREGGGADATQGGRGRWRKGRAAAGGSVEGGGGQTPLRAGGGGGGRGGLLLEAPWRGGGGRTPLRAGRGRWREGEGCCWRLRGGGGRRLLLLIIRVGTEDGWQ